jgi:two-component system, chemotaxis family, sensor kinase Cph1
VQEETSIYESRYHALVESPADLISRFKPDGQLTYVPQSYCDHFGKTSDQFINHSIYDDIPDDDRKITLSRLEGMSIQTPTTRGINSIKTSFGEIRVIDWVNTAIFNSHNKVIEVQSVGRDITDQLTIEAELKRSNIKFSQFAYLAAHDLKAPIRNVSQLADILKEDLLEQLDEIAQNIVGLMGERLCRRDQFIEALLTCATVGKERVAEPVNLNLVIRAVLENLETAIQDGNAEINLTELPVILGTQTDGIQLLQNLISNAIKFRADEPPTVNIPVKIVDNFCQLSISDTGIGIESEYFDDIFKPLRRLRNQGHYPGSGIGLAACNKICQRMGGKILVESTPCIGSTFTVFMPLLAEEKISQ